MKKRVLVVYARYGSGHKAIAEYVSNYIKGHNKCEVKLLDVTNYGNILAKLSTKLMDFVLKHHQELLFDIGYEIADHKISSLGNNLFAKKCFDCKELRKEIEEFNPDVTISSHFYCSNIINYYNKIGLIKSKLYTIITDYRAHEFWTRNYKYEDGYIVGNDIVKEELIKRGIPHRKIFAYGLPLNISDIANLDKEEVIYKRYHLKLSDKVYLFFGGSSSGSMYYYNYFKAICNLNINAHIIFISGNNVKLKNRCDSYVRKNKIKNVQVLGYSKDVLNLMKISDLVISKPGGATVTESMEMKVPMLLIPGVGGQEKYNARFMVKKKYGIKAKGIYSFKKCLNRLENNPNIIKKMKDRLNNLDNNKSVEKINNLVNRI